MATPNELHTVETEDGPVSFFGAHLGTVESRQVNHFHDPEFFAAKGERCYACRWSEYRIYRVVRYTDVERHPLSGRYVVVSYGQTIVPRERVLRRVQSTDSPAEVVEMLTTRKFGQKPVLTSSAARLLARASYLDDDIQEAYDNRAVL